MNGRILQKRATIQSFSSVFTSPLQQKSDAVTEFKVDQKRHTRISTGGFYLPSSFLSILRYNMLSPITLLETDIGHDPLHPFLLREGKSPLIYLEPFLGGGFKYCLCSSLFGEDEPILTSIFFRWVAQPPTSFDDPCFD